MEKYEPCLKIHIQMNSNKVHAAQTKPFCPPESSPLDLSVGLYT